MKPLENRRWYLLLTLALSAVLTAGLWSLSGLPLRLSGLSIFLFATLGLWLAVHRVVAIAMIKARPSLGTIA